MKKTMWIGILTAGAVLTAMGFEVAGANATDGAAYGATAPALAVMLLLTSGMLCCMLGAVGLSGLMGWIPGLEKTAETKPLSRIE